MQALTDLPTHGVEVWRSHLVPHLSVSVRELDCDFMAFSSHKMCGPMGVRSSRRLLLHG
jgi:hypothetical protein